MPIKGNQDQFTIGITGTAESPAPTVDLRHERAIGREPPRTTSIEHGVLTGSMLSSSGQLGGQLSGDEIVGDSSECLVGWQSRTYQAPRRLGHGKVQH